MRPNLRMATALLTLIFIGFSGFSQALTVASVTLLLRQANVSGASVRALKDGQLIFSYDFGSADMENNLKVSEKTQFGIMSLTKTFIAFAIMQMAVANQLNIAESPAKYIAGLPEAYRRVTIKDLLGHTSGVPDYVHAVNYMKRTRDEESPMQLLTPVLPLGLAFDPGTRSEYSNSNYILLGMVVEKIAGVRLSHYLKTHIFLPLGMNDTYLEESGTNNPGKAKGYLATAGSFAYEPSLNPSQYWAAGGMVSTANDLSTFDLALATGELLPVDVVRRMEQAVKLSDSTDTEYGLGFELLNGSDMEVTGSTGVGVGYNAANLQFSNTRATIIVLTNTTNGKSALLAKEINELLWKGQSRELHAPKDSLDQLVWSVIAKGSKGTVDTGDFADHDAAERFKGSIPFIQAAGKLQSVENKGEKLNPENTARRYFITFEKGGTSWVFIFSKGKKILVANHM